MPPPKWLGEDVVYENGTGPRYVLRAFEGSDVVDECGGNPVSPLYEPQARRLIEKAVSAGYSVEAEAHRPDGEVKITRHEST